MTVADRLTAIAENQRIVYEAGRDKGMAEEYDRMWDSFQSNGARTNYQGAFAGLGWNKTTFKPKYPIAPTGTAERMFWGSGDIDLSACSLDTSLATSFAYAFQNSAVEVIPFLDMTGSAAGQATNYTFANAQSLRAIERLKVSETTPFASTTFASCRSLTTLNIEGTIAKSGINLSAATELSKKSLTGVVNALSAKTTGYSITLPLAAVNKAYETTQGANNGSSSEAWQTLIKNKNWTINLV